MKTVNGVTTHYLYDGLDIVQTATDRTTTGYLRSRSVDEVMAITSADRQASHILHDALLNSVAIVDAGSNVVTSFTYGPFGETPATAPTSNPFQFTGRENENVAGLYYYRSRYYKPSFQRFISQDTLGLVAGDTNLYAYNANQPINFVDPLGWWTPP